MSLGPSPLQAMRAKDDDRVINSTRRIAIRESIMETYTLGTGVWLRRLMVRNPLVRVADRIEALAFLLLCVFAIGMVPVAGAMGTAVYEDAADTFAAQRLDRHEVDAIVTGDSRLAPEPYEKPYLTEVRWEFNNATRTDELRTKEMSAGDHLTVWVDDAGNRTTKPPDNDAAAAQAVIAATALWTTLVTSGAAAWLLLRTQLNRVRSGAWDRELDDLADNGGRTNNTA